MRVAIATATAVVVTGLLASCLAVTGSTDGYRLVEADSGCSGTASCGTGAGKVCCLTLSATQSGVVEVPVCQDGPSCSPILLGLPAVQICGGDGDCKPGVGCIAQMCELADAGVSMAVCGLLIPGCKVAPADASAGETDAGLVDAASTDVVDAGGSG